MQLRIRSITYLAEDINGYEFVDPNGHDLPRFAAGAHVGVRLGDAGREGVWRDYSLWNDPAERRRYCIAVLREGEGSRRLHDEIRVGDTVETTLPRNHFPLAEGPARRRRRGSKTTGRFSCGWQRAAANMKYHRARRFWMCCAGTGSTHAAPANSGTAARA